MSTYPTVIFVSRRNSLRSKLAQASLSHIARNHFPTLSCGQPGQISRTIHPAAIEALRIAGVPLPSEPLRSWADLALPDLCRSGFVVTLDSSTVLSQPRWPGQPDSALWSFPDVAALDDMEASVSASVQILHALRRRLELFVSLFVHGGSRDAIRSDVRDLAYLR